MASGTRPRRFGSRAAWRRWLEANHARVGEIWLIHPKKGSGHPGLGYEAAVEEALCFGWIDGKLRARDEETFELRYSPRRANSVWSVSNLRRVEALVKSGRMTQAGMAKVQEAKASGAWQAAAQREDPGWIPKELERALRRRKGALAAFRNLPQSRRQQLGWWVESARRDDTRRQRIRAVLVELCDRP